MDILAVLMCFALGLYLRFRLEDAAALRRTPPADQYWVGACENAGVSSVQYAHQSITGVAGDLEVQVTPVAQQDISGGRRTTADVIVSSRRRSPGFTLRSTGHTPRGDTRSDGLRTGDETFDGRFEVDGTAVSVFSVLDAQTRQLLVDQDRKGSLHFQGLRSTTRCTGIPTVREIEAVVRGALAIAERVSRPLDARAALAERATTDPVPGVRREAMRVLGRSYPGDPATKAAAHTAVKDPDADVRIQAAAALGEEGTETLLAHLAQPGLRDATVASAVFFLDLRLAPTRAAELLADARDRRRHHTALACIERLGKGPVEQTLAPLVEVLKVDDGELGGAAARALGSLGSEAAESALVSALGRELPALRLEAAQALGRVGSTASVIRLKEAAERNKSDDGFRVMAQRAIAAIQARAAGAEHGQLSVADDHAGHVSLAEREAGQLSVPECERGQLSVPDDEAGRLSISRTGQRTG
jgi:hypothetical protein